MSYVVNNHINNLYVVSNKAVGPGKKNAKIITVGPTSTPDSRVFKYFFCKKLSLYIQISNIHLGLGFEFGSKRIKGLAIVCLRALFCLIEIIQASGNRKGSVIAILFPCVHKKHLQKSFLISLLMPKTFIFFMIDFRANSKFPSHWLSSRLS